MSTITKLSTEVVDQVLQTFVEDRQYTPKSKLSTLGFGTIELEDLLEDLQQKAKLLHHPLTTIFSIQTVQDVYDLEYSKEWMVETKEPELPNAWHQDIAEMHTKFGVNKHALTMFEEALESNDTAKVREYLKFRIDMVQEEVNELKKAFEENDAEGAVDALIDNIVFAIGTLNVFGVDAQKAWEAVHKANMAKEPGVKATRPNKFGFPDLNKPEGWVGPSHEGNHGLFPIALHKGE